MTATLDFSPLPERAATEAIVRPSLSYWQDAWRRLKRNRPAMVALAVVVALLVFTVIGPLVWRVDPAAQDVDRISEPPSIGRTATVVAEYTPWAEEAGSALDLRLPEQRGDDIVFGFGTLPAPTALRVDGDATTREVRLRWNGVPTPARDAVNAAAGDKGASAVAGKSRGEDTAGDNGTSAVADRNRGEDAAGGNGASAVADKSRGEDAAGGNGTSAVAGYRIFRTRYAPENHLQLGLPLADIAAGQALRYEDRLDLDDGRYYYSVVALDAGNRPSSRYTVLAVDVTRAITAREAHERGLIANVADVKIGDTVALAAHPLGTDYLGRDMLSRLMHGARVSLFIGIAAPLLYVLIGVAYGALAGYVGGALDTWLMRFADFMVALPFLLLMILMRIAFGIEGGESGILPMLIALVALSWPSTARLVRGQILQIREEGYVQAARLLGAPTHWLVIRHMLPNTIGVVLVTLTFAVPSAIFTEAFLSFIGMGVAPPTPSWGSMCNEGRKTMLVTPHELIAPAVLISLTVLAFNLLGDGLRDALDARMRNRD